MKTLIMANRILSVIAGIAVIFGAYLVFKPKNQPYQFIEVKRGTISQEVEVTGRVTAVQNLSLAFVGSGRVAEVRRNVGDRVSPGEPIVILEQSDVLAQLAQAKANAASEKARLADLVAGARPEEVAIKKTAVEQAQADLANAYTSVTPNLEGAYILANDSVRKQINDMFTGADTASPQLVFSTPDLQAQINTQSLRYKSGLELNNWRAELNALYSASTTNIQLQGAFGVASGHLDVIHTFLNQLSDALNKSNLSGSVVANYKAELTTAGTQIATAITNVNSASQSVSNKKLALQKAENDLNLLMSGSTKEAVNAEQALSDAADANVNNIQAQLDKTVLRAPIRGILTKQDAKVGQIVSPGAELVGLISEGNYEIDANVPEMDVGKMSVNDSVNITLDAFSGETFTGKVFFINPAETTIDGAINYKVKVALDKPDARIKSGFTANLGIITETKENVLLLPQFAILQNDEGIFVRAFVNGATKDIPVTLGITNRDGQVEILSGVKEGERFINIGLKTQ
ncbi:MAG: efflux RND transporter periplasmic adaptor subunit [Candidatus Liptonbacteria bacterium]|nr:efflux RND transporter periplasmic adaptor subunit [Candidatus Liptonbacteria bacterium]